VKASDITDEAFLDAMRKVLELRPNPASWVNRWDLASALDGHPEWVNGQRGELSIPEKVVLAKAKRMIKRGLILGCACGCRGDFEFPA
jgi:hypothetical protein